MSVKAEPVDTVDPVDPVDLKDTANAMLTPKTTDELMFGTLQARVESLNSELSVIRKNRNQIMRRLKKKMNDESLEEIQCGNFVLVRSEQESSDEEPEIAFDRKRLAEHFSEDAADSYCSNPNNHKKKRRNRTTFRVERHVVEVLDS